MEQNEYRVTVTINVYIKADSEEEAEGKFDDCDISFKGDDGTIFETMLIDSEISQVIG